MNLTKKTVTQTHTVVTSDEGSVAIRNDELILWKDHQGIQNARESDSRFEMSWFVIPEVYRVDPLQTIHKLRAEKSGITVWNANNQAVIFSWTTLRDLIKAAESVSTKKLKVSKFNQPSSCKSCSN